MKVLRNFYRISAWALVVTVFAIIVVSAAMPGQLVNNSLPDMIRIPLGMLGAFSAIGALVLWLGMLWNCAVASKLPILARFGWFLLILFTIYVGAVIYYFVKYRDQDKSSVKAVRPSIIGLDS